MSISQEGIPLEPDNEMNVVAAASSHNKDMFKPKEKPKVIRVLTVLAYVLSVSMAAILLSIYYIFMWEGHPHIGAQTDPQNGIIMRRIDTNHHHLPKPEHLVHPNRTNLSNLSLNIDDNVKNPTEMQQQIIETVTENTSFDVTTLTTESTTLWTDGQPPPSDSVEDDYPRRDDFEKKSFNYDDND